jgi:hypothetical protein
MNGIRRGEIVDEASNWLVGGGIVTMALFPLALPGIALLLIAALPLVALALPFLLIWGIGVAVLHLVRGLGRRATGLQRRERAETQPAQVGRAAHGW